MEMSDALFGFLSALLGAVVGGLFTLWATNKAIREENAKENRRDDKEVENLLNALRVELNTLWSLHGRKIEPMLKQLPEDGMLEFYYPLTQDYFTIYNSNASVIGRIQNQPLMEQLVLTYNKCKKVVDAYSYNNELYEEYRRTDSVGKERIRQQLIDSAQMIKSDHNELQGYVDTLMAMMEKRK